MLLVVVVVVIQLSIISNSLTTNQLPFCNKFMLCSTILNCCTNFDNLTLLKLNLLNLHTFFTQGILWTCHTKQKYFLTCSTVLFFYYLISITNELNRNCTSERTQIKCTSHHKQIKVDVHGHVLCKNDKLILSQFLISAVSLRSCCIHFLNKVSFANFPMVVKPNKATRCL